MLLPIEALMSKEPDGARLRIVHTLSKSKPVEAISEYQKLVDQGSTLASLYIGYIYRSLGEIDQAQLWFEKAFKSDSVEGALNLGFIAAKRGSWELAENWFRKAADAGDAIGLYYVAISLINQQVFESRSIEILSILNEARLKGAIRAENRLAHFYMRGAAGLKKIPLGCAMFISSLVKAAKETLRDPQSRRLW